MKEKKEQITKEKLPFAVFVVKENKGKRLDCKPIFTDIISERINEMINGEKL